MICLLHPHSRTNESELESWENFEARWAQARRDCPRNTEILLSAGLEGQVGRTGRRTTGRYRPPQKHLSGPVSGLLYRIQDLFFNGGTPDQSAQKLQIQPLLSGHEQEQREERDQKNCTLQRETGQGRQELAISCPHSVGERTGHNARR